MTTQESHTQKDPSSFTQNGPERVRVAVVDAARKLFSQRGINAVSVREIAREVGVSHTLVHLYFGSKEEILRQVLSTPASHPEAIEGADPVDVFSKTFLAVAANPDELRVLAAALMEGFVPGRIEFDPVLLKALTARLTEVHREESAVDSAMLGAMLASAAIGWAVAGEWIVGQMGLTGDHEQASEGVGNAMRQMITRVSA